MKFEANCSVDTVPSWRPEADKKVAEALPELIANYKDGRPMCTNTLTVHGPFGREPQSVSLLWDREHLKKRVKKNLERGIGMWMLAGMTPMHRILFLCESNYFNSEEALRYLATPEENNSDGSRSCLRLVWVTEQQLRDDVVFDSECPFHTTSKGLIPVHVLEPPHIPTADAGTFSEDIPHRVMQNLSVRRTRPEMPDFYFPMPILRGDNKIGMTMCEASNLGNRRFNISISIESSCFFGLTYPFLCARVVNDRAFSKSVLFGRYQLNGSVERARIQPKIDSYDLEFADEKHFPDLLAAYELNRLSGMYFFLDTANRALRNHQFAIGEFNDRLYEFYYTEVGIMFE